MPLSANAPRRPIHHRRIDCYCFKRDDGFWDIEARITDVKNYAYQDWRRGLMPPGTPVHDMLIRLTITNEMEITDAEAVLEAAPYLTCFDVSQVFKRLVGERIGPGWRERVRRRIGRRESCTHMIELLDPMATSAYQALTGGHEPENHDWVSALRASNEKPFFVNGCYSWRADGPVLKDILPDIARRLNSAEN